MQVSYSDVFNIELEHDQGDAIAIGDLVRTGASQFPQYHVIAMDGDKVWLRNAQNGQDAVTTTSRCRKLVRL